MVIGLADIGVVFGISLATAVLSYGTLGLVRSTRRRTIADSGSHVVIRFTRGRMVSAHPQFLEILTHRGWDNSVAGLRNYFAFRFRGLPARLESGSEDFKATFPSREADDPIRLILSRRRGVLTFLLAGPSAQADVGLHVTKYRQHLHWLSKWVGRSGPNPVWITDDEGKVFWANTAYRRLARQLGQQPYDGASILDGLDPSRSLPDREQRRYRLSLSGEASDRWIDVTEVSEHAMCLHHAVDVTAVVQAELAQRTFVQTLTKTFAQLSSGLAIFDRARQLALFNPALVDLTGLSAEYLSGRPGYLSFFDMLREKNIIPEPRSYATWRERIFDLIAAAENGRYQETWALPSGKTYRVTGRPHPNGAVAFIVEDISGEVTLTRRFREQLDMSHSVIEALEEAVAVFSPQGMLSYTNSAYRDLWGIPAETSHFDMSVSDASVHWQKQCDATPVWGDFRDFVSGHDERAEWEAMVRLQDGRALDCRFRPLAGGATLVIFRTDRAPEPRKMQSAG